MSARPSIAIIGAGVIGLSIARVLARSGADVTIFERQGIGAGTSGNTFAWVNANGKSPDSYYELNLAGMTEHERLQMSDYTEGHWYIQAGTYEWATGEAKIERLVTRVERLRGLGYPVEPVKAEQLTARIPEIRIDKRSGDIWHFPTEAYVWVEVLLARLWSEAKEHGAVLRTPAEVVDLEEGRRSATLTLSTGEQWRGDYVVSATGRWSTSVVGMLGQKFAVIDADQPNKIACGFLGKTGPLHVQVNANLITPEMNIRPNGAGRLLLQTPDLDHRADPVYTTPPDGLIGQEMRRRLTSVLDNTHNARIERIDIGQRARPADGLPAVGFVTDQQRVYVVTTHSGVTLAPLLGKLVAQELLDDDRSPLLADYSPARLLGKTVEDFPVFATIHFPAAQ